MPQTSRRHRHALPAGQFLRRAILTGTALGLLAACDRPLDFDLRGNFGNTLDTAEASRQPVANRPAPDARGVISYPNYQVAVARQGDTVTDLANRVGVSPEELARFNGLRPADPLRPEEIVALPRRVAEPSPATGAAIVCCVRDASRLAAARAARRRDMGPPATIRDSGPPRYSFR